MKKIVVIIVICIMAVVLLCFYNNQKEMVNVNSDAIVLEKEVDGMKVTMFGGTNMPDKGASQCMGYYIRTKNGKNIIMKIIDISYGGTNFAMIEPKEILN